MSCRFWCSFSSHPSSGRLLSRFLKYTNWWDMRWWLIMRWDGRYKIIILINHLYHNYMIKLVNWLFYDFSYHHFIIFLFFMIIFFWNYYYDKIYMIRDGWSYLSHHLPSYLISPFVSSSVSLWDGGDMVDGDGRWMKISSPIMSS